MSFLFGALFLLGSTSVNAQYVGETEAMSILEAEIAGINTVKVPQTANPASLTISGQTTTSGNLQVENRAKKLFFKDLLGNIKEGENGVGAAIAQTMSNLEDVFSGNADRSALLDNAEAAAQILLQD